MGFTALEGCFISWYFLYAYHWLFFSEPAVDLKHPTLSSPMAVTVFGKQKASWRLFWDILERYIRNLLEV